MPLSTNFITNPITNFVTSTNTVTNFVTITNPITNFITSTNILATVEISKLPQLEKIWYQDPTFWIPLAVTLIGTIATVFGIITTARIMLNANKISAQSVEEMKNQYEQTEKNNQRKDDKKELKDFIAKNFLLEEEKLNDKVSEEMIIIFIVDSYNHLANLIILSYGLFYENNLRNIYNKILICKCIMTHPQVYSNKAKNQCSDVLRRIFFVLYKALTDEKVFEVTIIQIGFELNALEAILTPPEKEQFEKYKAEKQRF